MRQSLELVLRFAVQMLVAAALFSAVAGIAFLLWLGTEWLYKQGIPDYMHLGLSAITALLFSLDVLCFVCFTIAESWKLLRAIYLSIWDDEP
jgi:integral membrane sensor domain MASE1